MKLHMYSDYIVRSQIFDDIMEKYPDDSYLQEQITVLSSIDNRDQIKAESKRGNDIWLLKA